MGTDVYLEWDTKTEEEQKAQCTGCAIDAGEEGYLRASIGMVLEEHILRLLFPEKYWTGESREEYDFEGNYEQLNELGFRYLASVAKNEPFEKEGQQHETLQQQRETAGAITQVIRNAIPGGGWIQTSEIDEFRWAVSWLDSVYSFFELGIRKQRKGLKPYPYISW
ncbi:MAG: hypothetical protein WCS52_05660 [bacterium]|jgi:hypothetical protein